LLPKLSVRRKSHSEESLHIRTVFSYGSAGGKARNKNNFNGRTREPGVSKRANGAYDGTIWTCECLT